MIKARVSFKEKYPHEFRVQFSRKLLKLHSNKIPVILTKEFINDKNSRLCDLENSRCLFPDTFTIAHLIIWLRSRLILDEKESLCLFFNGKMISEKRFTLQWLLEMEKEADGFLYLSYGTENIYG